MDKKWTNSTHRAWKVRDRICELQIIRDLEKLRNSTQDKTNIISIIKIHAPPSKPTSSRLSKYMPLHQNQHHLDYQNTCPSIKTNIISIIKIHAPPSKPTSSRLSKYMPLHQNQHHLDYQNTCPSIKTNIISIIKIHAPPSKP